MSAGGRTNAWIGVGLGVWLSCAIAAFALLAAYQATPGPTAGVGDWPAGAALPHPERPTIVLFLHPECGCSRATIAELNRLLPRLRTQPALRIVMCGEGDAITSLAAAVSGADMHTDPDAQEARRFGATTSGHVFAYGSDGGLQFSGGITGARAHEGPNAGIEAVIAQLSGRSHPVRSTPVFGCLLYDPEVRLDS